MSYGIVQRIFFIKHLVRLVLIIVHLLHVLLHTILVKGIHLCILEIRDKSTFEKWKQKIYTTFIQIGYLHKQGSHLSYNEKEQVFYLTTFL